MRTEPFHNRSGVRRGIALATAQLAAVSLVIALGGGEAPAQLDRIEAKQDDLQAEIDQENGQIDSLIAEEAALREQEEAVADELAAKQAELDEATQELHEARDHLEQVRAHLEDAKAALRKMLVQIYKSNPPDVVDFVLSSETFSDAIAQTEYLAAINDHQDAVVSRVTELRADVTATVDRLTESRARITAARDEIAARRDELAAAEAHLASQHAALVAAKEERRQTLASLQDRERRLTKRAARREPTAETGGGSAPAPSGATATLSADGSAVAPANAPAAVSGAIAAANSIEDAPYAWGGGHGSFESSGYDCSGAVSYALHGGGLLSAPLDSGGLMGYGDPGPGKWITVYANPGHAFVVIAGLRWDTSGDANGTGPSWYTEMRSTAGYVVRHPPGL
jgi:cell wall-associated NlpC family hydrolase